MVLVSEPHFVHRSNSARRCVRATPIGLYQGPLRRAARRSHFALTPTLLRDGRNGSEELREVPVTTSCKWHEIA